MHFHTCKKHTRLWLKIGLEKSDELGSIIVETNYQSSKGGHSLSTEPLLL